MEARPRRPARPADRRAEAQADRLRVTLDGASADSRRSTDCASDHALDSARLCRTDSASADIARAVVAALAAHGLAVSSEQGVHAQLVCALPDADDVDAPSRAGADVVTRAAEDEQRRLVVRVDRPEPAQRLERPAIAAVRRGRQQEDIRGARRERVDGRPAIGVAGHAVRFVDDDDVPWAGGDGGQHLGPLDVVHRRNRRRQRRPRVDPNRQRRRQPPEHTPVDCRRGDGEALRQLVRPLLAQARRREDQDACDRAARQKLGDDQAGLNRFAEADFVREQQPRSAPADDGQRGLELMRHQLDARDTGGAQRAWRCVGGDQRAAGAAPAHLPDEAGTVRPFETRQDVERSDHAALEARTRRAEPTQGDDVAVLVRPHVDDAPACAAHDDEIAGADAGSFARRRRF